MWHSFVFGSGGSATLAQPAAILIGRRVFSPAANEKPRARRGFSRFLTEACLAGPFRRCLLRYRSGLLCQGLRRRNLLRHGGAAGLGNLVRPHLAVAAF